MTKLIVHLGGRKTGTTYIQHALGRNTALVASAGVYLPTAGRFDLNPGNVSHHHLAFELLGDPRFRPDLGGWDELAKELAETAPETAMLTCEVFEEAITEGGRAGELLERCRSIADDVVFVLVVRDWMEFANSMYCQLVKMFAPPRSFEAYVRAQIEGGATKFVDRYAPLLDAPDAAMTVLHYRDLQNPDPVRAMMAAGGVELPSDAHLELHNGPINTSLGAIGVEVTMVLAKFLAGTYPDWQWQSPAAQELHIESLMATDRRGWNTEAFWGWTPELTADLAPEIHTDLEALARRVWETPWPDPLPVDRRSAVSDFQHYPPALLHSALAHIAEMRDRYDELRGDRG